MIVRHATSESSRGPLGIGPTAERTNEGEEEFLFRYFLERINDSQRLPNRAGSFAQEEDRSNVAAQDHSIMSKALMGPKLIKLM